MPAKRSSNFTNPVYIADLENKPKEQNVHQILQTRPSYYTINE
ncbi:hypothetical protein B4113_0799 [Geobacillus sp. B4113_201601]|nr:hypothetical protein B4113_0799 [Geobacillus sp. B4113_201601]